MGSFLTTPKTLHTQELVEGEVNRLLHGYSYLMKGICEKGKVSNVDSMKQSLIHQQWNMVFPLLHSSKKEKYMKKFQEYVSQFNIIKNTGLTPIQELEEKLLD
jgi:hypothetical protein